MENEYTNIRKFETSQNTTMITFPNAKINIGLNITEKRPDGFHNIETAMYPLKGILFDALEVIAVPRPLTPTLSSGEGGGTAKLHISGNLIPGNPYNNLCIKAYDLIRKDYPQVPPIDIHLHKAIPIGAGFGGGSSDGAFFIRLLSEKFELGISWGEMHNYARQLGSDCSFFVSNKPAFAEGKGDQLESINLDLSGYYIALVCPDIHVNTAEAYAGVKPKKTHRSLEKDIQKLPVSQWKKYIYNDFEESIFQKYPEIKKIKEKLYLMGAIYASMSGSGSAVYGIFKKAINLKSKFINCQVWEGRLT